MVHTLVEDIEWEVAVLAVGALRMKVTNLLVMADGFTVNFVGRVAILSDGFGDGPRGGAVLTRPAGGASGRRDLLFTP